MQVGGSEVVAGVFRATVFAGVDLNGRVGGRVSRTGRRWRGYWRECGAGNEAKNRRHWNHTSGKAAEGGLASSLHVQAIPSLGYLTREVIEDDARPDSRYARARILRSLTKQRNCKRINRAARSTNLSCSVVLGSRSVRERGSFSQLGFRLFDLLNECPGQGTGLLGGLIRPRQGLRTDTGPDDRRQHLPSILSQEFSPFPVKHFVNLASLI